MAPEGAGAGAGEGGGAGGGAGGAGTNGAGGTGEGGAAGGAGGGNGAGNAPSYTTWAESLADPKVKEAAKRFNSFDDMLTSNITLRTELSDRFRAPGEKATDEDKAKYRKAMGVPADATGYVAGFKLPPEMGEMSGEDKVIIERLSVAAHKAGVPPVVFNDLMLGLIEVAKSGREQLEKEMREGRAAADAALDKEWGADKTKKLALANRAAAVHGGDAFVEFLNTTKIDGGAILGDHPIVTKFLAGIGAKTDEADLIIKSNANEVADARAQIAELNKTVPPGSPGYTDKAHQAKLQALWAKVGGSEPIVGTQGRTV